MSRRWGRCFVVHQLGHAKAEHYDHSDDGPCHVVSVNGGVVIADHKEQQGHGHVGVVLGAEAGDSAPGALWLVSGFDRRDDFTLRGPDAHPDVSGHAHAEDGPRVDKDRAAGEAVFFDWERLQKYALIILPNLLWVTRTSGCDPCVGGAAPKIRPNAEKNAIYNRKCWLFFLGRRPKRKKSIPAVKPDFFGDLRLKIVIFFR